MVKILGDQRIFLISVILKRQGQTMLREIQGTNTLKKVNRFFITFKMLKSL